MKTIYVANDGKQFDSIDDCKKYEAYGIKAKVALVNLDLMIQTNVVLKKLVL